MTPKAKDLVILTVLMAIPTVLFILGFSAMAYGIPVYKKLVENGMCLFLWAHCDSARAGRGRLASGFDCPGFPDHGGSQISFIRGAWLAQQDKSGAIVRWHPTLIATKGVLSVDA